MDYQKEDIDDILERMERLIDTGRDNLSKLASIIRTQIGYGCLPQLPNIKAICINLSKEICNTGCGSGVKPEKAENDYQSCLVTIKDYQNELKRLIEK